MRSRYRHQYSQMPGTLIVRSGSEGIVALVEREGVERRAAHQQRGQPAGGEVEGPAQVGGAVLDREPGSDGGAGVQAGLLI